MSGPGDARGPSRARPAGGTARTGILGSREELERLLQTAVRRVGGLAARVHQMLLPQHQGDIQRASGHRNAMRRSGSGGTGTPTTTKARADTARQRGALDSGRKIRSLIVTFDNGGEGDQRPRVLAEEGSTTKIEWMQEVKREEKKRGPGIEGIGLSESG